MIISPPDTVDDVGPPPNAAGNPPPIARSSIRKYGWLVAFAHVVASTRVELIEKNCVPSRNQRMVSGETLLSHSTVYVWNEPQHVEHDTVPPMPLDSLHGPPGLVPQCRVPNSVATALMLSMKSSSPTLGQVPPLRMGVPRAQNAGQ